MHYVEYDELSKISLPTILTKNGEVTCIVTNDQASALKSSWDAREKYAKCYHAKDKKLVILFRQILWILTRAFYELKHKNIHYVTELYLNHANQLKPISFKNVSNNKVEVTFNLKRR